ncbi:MAG: recombinase family protein, partial [Firmicutes bacterium]|nr:recombinase family protein [Bacillota bacterium]
RPGVQRLIEDAKDGRINLILVKDLSRFGRNYVQIGQYTDYLFPMIGCRFIALNDGVDTIHNDNDIMPFRNLFNEFQSRDTSKKIKAVKRACASNGMFMGYCAPYGYQKDPADKHRFLIDEPAAAVVRRIFSWRSEGYGANSIAQFLNAEHVLPPREHWAQRENRPNNFQHNGLWNQITVRDMLCNEAYIGSIVQGKQGTMSYKNKRTVRKPEEEWIRVEGMHEPIIDRTTWDLCREIEEKNYRPRTTKNGEVTLFSGLLVCADCGSHMIHRPCVATRKNGKKVSYKAYLCGNYSRSGKLACTTHRIGIGIGPQRCRDIVKVHSFAHPSTEI